VCACLIVRVILFSRRYVTGEFRFRRGYNKHNPRQMVKLWAEKEFRNLTRLRQAGIRCPEPVLLRSHVLVMDFIGKDGWAAPKLKEASITETQARELYLSCVIITRNMYVTPAESPPFPLFKRRALMIISPVTRVLTFVLVWPAEVRDSHRVLACIQITVVLNNQVPKGKACAR
jgi:hypothetical protein